MKRLIDEFLRFIFVTCDAPRRVQESDGSFFESFTALSWKRENRRMSSIRAAETRAEAMPVDEKETIKEDEIETVNEREQLYMDVLSSIANSVGCQQPGGQVSGSSNVNFHTLTTSFSFTLIVRSLQRRDVHNSSTCVWHHT